MSTRPIPFKKSNQSNKLHSQTLYTDKSETLTREQWEWLERLEQDFNFQRIDNHPNPPYLQYSSHGLSWMDGKSKLGIHLDFTQRRILDRLQRAGKKSELAIKACGHKPGSKADVLDATAGLGTDGLLLASASQHVILMERNPVVCALLRDGLERAKDHNTLRLIIEKVALWWGEFTELTEASHVDVVHLDPMFPESGKSAKNKKGISALQGLESPPDQEEEACLLDQARKIARTRVIVKRPKSATYLANQAPGSQFVKGDFRYDVYWPNQAQKKPA